MRSVSKALVDELRRKVVPNFVDTWLNKAMWTKNVCEIILDEVEIYIIKVVEVTGIVSGGAEFGFVESAGIKGFIGGTK